MVTRQSRSSGLINRNNGAAPAGRQLLGSDDFTYDGFVTVGRYGGFNSSDYGADALTHRYVNGQLRMVYTGFGENNVPNDNWHPIREATLPEGRNGETITVVATHPRAWLDWSDYLCWKSAWWEEEEQRLWTGSGFDYPEDTNATPVLFTRSIGATDGFCTNHSGWFGFEGIGQRQAFGKVQKVPTWARTQYGFRKYISLSGGYTSLLNQGLGPSMGPFFMGFDDPHSYGGILTPGNAGYVSPPNVPASARDVYVSCRSGSGPTDWYAGGYAARTFDRGVRLNGTINFLEQGAWFSSPTVVVDDPNGWNRWCWCDSYGGSGNWIDNDAGTRTKHGVVMIASLYSGTVQYIQSQIRRTASATEIHIYHPDDIAAGKDGLIPLWAVRPRIIKDISDILETRPRTGLLQTSATFDPVTNKLYVMVQDAWTHIYIFSVAG